MLIIGNAGGTVARAYGELYPDVEIDGVEIDPEVSEAAREYIGLDDNPRLHVITADGRPFLELTDETLRHHRRRRLPPAVHPLLPGDAGVLRDREANTCGPAGSSRSTSRACRATSGCRRRSAAPSWRSFRRPGAGGRCASTSSCSVSTRRGEPRGAGPAGRSRAGRRRAARAALPGRPAAGYGRRAAPDRRPRPGRVADRPDDHRLHRPRRRGRRGLPADAARRAARPRAPRGSLPATRS